MRIGETFWVAVQTKPAAEQIADVDLRRAGLETFYPFSRVRKKRKKPNGRFEISWKDVPYFTGYIFARIDYASLPVVRGNKRSVTDVVSIEGMPLRIPAEVMDELMSRTDEQGYMGRIDHVTRAPFAIDQKVKITGDHAAAGLIAQISFDSGRKTRVWLDMLGSRREIEIDPHLLKVVHTKPQEIVDEAAEAA